MQEPSTPERDKTLGRVEEAIYVLLVQRDEQRPWSVQEVEREIGDAGAVVDALRTLNGLGLVHRCGEFVWATRAALAADGIAI
jgi:hypothetical protein